MESKHDKERAQDIRATEKVRTTLAFETSFVKWIMGIVSACVVAFICWVSSTTYMNSINIATMKPELDAVYSIVEKHWNMPPINQADTTVSYYVDPRNDVSMGTTSNL